MRVLKRDLPLTILVDILVQVMFVLSLILASVLFPYESSVGLADPRSLELEIEKLKLELSAYKEENERLKAESAGLKLEVERLKARLDDIAKQNKNLQDENLKLSKELGRDGIKDCFKPRTDTFVVKWKSADTVLITRGKDFESYLNVYESAGELLGEVSRKNLGEHLAPIKAYQKKNDCLMTVAYYYPDGMLQNEWRPNWSELWNIFRRGWFYPE